MRNQRANGSHLEGNRAEGNTVGFSLESSDNNTLIGNLARDNSTGYKVALGSKGNTFMDNTADDNRTWGIEDTSTGGVGAAVTDNSYVDTVCIGNGADSEPLGLCDPSP